MKRLLSLLLALPLSAFAADIKLQWDPNPAADAVTLYRVYELSPEPVEGEPLGHKVGETGETTLTLANVADGPHAWHVTALNAFGESGPSNSVSTTPPTAPKNLMLTSLAPIARPPFVPPAGGGPTLIIDENFEGSGTPAGWFLGGSSDFDYTAAPINGAQSFNCPSGSYAAVTLPGGPYSAVSYKIRFRFGALGGNYEQFMNILDASFNALGGVLVTPSGQLMNDFTHFTTDTMSDGVDYWVWLDFLAGGVANFFFNTANTKPAIGSTKHVVGVWNTSFGLGISQFQLTSINSITAVFDDVQVATSPIP